MVIKNGTKNEEEKETEHNPQQEQDRASDPSTEDEQNVTATTIKKKRMLFTHTNSIVVTVHRTFETDLDKIEKEIIAQTFDEIKE